MSKKQIHTLFVWNNYTQQNKEDITAYILTECSYGCYAEEMGELNQTPHLQGYLRWKNERSIAKFASLFPGLHAGGKLIPGTNASEPTRGSALQNINYCLGMCPKKGMVENPTFWEHGDRPAQGERSDLTQLVTDLSDGITTIEQIMFDQPNMYHQYGRTLEKVMEEVNKRKRRTKAPTCFWLWGPAGTGKSYRAHNSFGDDVYAWEFDDKGWQDKYTGQKVVVFDDMDN